MESYHDKTIRKAKESGNIDPRSHELKFRAVFSTVCARYHFNRASHTEGRLELCPIEFLGVPHCSSIMFLDDRMNRLAETCAEEMNRFIAEGDKPGALALWDNLYPLSSKKAVELAKADGPKVEGLIAEIIEDYKRGERP